MIRKIQADSLNITDIYGIFINKISSFVQQVSSLLISAILYSVVLIIGYVVGRFVGKILEILLRNIIGIDYWMKKKDYDKAIFGLKISNLVSNFVSFYIYLYSLQAYFDLLSLEYISNFFKELLIFYPKIVSSIILMIVGLILAFEIKRFLISNLDVKYSKEMSSLIYLIVIVSFLTSSLEIIGINLSILEYIILAIFLTISISLSLILGLGLGLALKEEIRPYLREFLEKMLKK